MKKQQPTVYTKNVYTKKILIIGDEDSALPILMERFLNISLQTNGTLNHNSTTITITGTQYQVNCITSDDLIGSAPFANTYFKNLDFLIFCPKTPGQLIANKESCQRFIERHKLSLDPITLTPKDWAYYLDQKNNHHQTELLNKDYQKKPSDLTKLFTQLLNLHNPQASKYFCSLRTSDETAELNTESAMEVTCI